MSSWLCGKSFDVAVVGGGPAGASAALDLARQGVGVVVLERASLPRYKPCGGGVVRRAVRLLPFELGDALELDCYAVELNFLDSGLRFSVTREEPIVSMTMRSRFDFLLVSEAARAGASLWSDCGVLDLVRQNDGVKISTTRGTLFARFAVIAAGAGTVLARKAGWAEDLHRIPALEWEVHVDAGTLDRFQRAPRFDFDVVDPGYGWIFPKRDHLSAGILSFEGASANLRRSLESYLARAGVTEIRRVERHGFVLPARPRRGSLVKGRVLLAGDAAGLLDPLTCEGITYAIKSGQLAARALLESRFEPGGVRSAFHAGLRRDILPELRIARLLSRLLYRLPRLSRRLFRRQGQALCEAVTEVFTGELSYRKALLESRDHASLLLGRPSSDGS